MFDYKMASSIKLIKIINTKMTKWIDEFDYIRLLSDIFRQGQWYRSTHRMGRHRPLSLGRFLPYSQVLDWPASKNLLGVKRSDPTSVTQKIV